MTAYDERTRTRSAAFAAAREPQQLQELISTPYTEAATLYGAATGLGQALIDDLLRQIADLEKRVRLAELRNQLLTRGVTADSPAVLDADGERLAREERRS